MSLPMRTAAKTPRIEFQRDQDRTREAIAYLASKSKAGLDKYMICKLLFLADKYHLVRYGRTITGDRYFAMPHGPAPSTILSLLTSLTEEENSRLADALTVDRSYQYPRFLARRAPDVEYLSASDIEALDETFARFGSKSFPELRALTHEMAAYQKAWDKRGNKNSVPMAFEDFFEEDSDAIAGVLEEAIENSQLRKTFPTSKAL